MSSIRRDPFAWSWFATGECALDFPSARRMYLVCIQPAISFKIHKAKGHANTVLFVKMCTVPFFSGLSLLHLESEATFGFLSLVYWDIRSWGKMTKLRRPSGSFYVIGICVRLFIFSASSGRGVPSLECIMPVKSPRLLLLTDEYIGALKSELLFENAAQSHAWVSAAWSLYYA